MNDHESDIGRTIGLVRFEGTISAIGIESARRERVAYDRAVFDDPRLVIDANDNHNSSEGIDRQLTLERGKEIKKGAIRNIAHDFLNSLRFMYKSALGYDKISHRADQQIVKDVLATDGGSVEHLILHAHSRGATGGALGYINELCAQALQSKAQRKAQNKQGPSRHQLKRLSLIIADPVSVMHMTDFATKEVSKLSLADRLRQIEHEFGIFIDLTVRYPHTVETDFLKANDQFKELAENYKEARVVYTGFSHDCGGAVLTTDLFFKITEPTPSLKEYKSDLSLSKEQQIQRLVDVLRPSLFEGGLPLSSESVAVTSLREDPFRHLLTHRNMDQLLIYERLGYVSKELVDDFQYFVEQHEQAVIQEYGKGRKREGHDPKLTTSPAMLELRHFTNSTVKSRIKNIVKGGKPGSMEKGVGVSRNPFKTSTGFGLDSDRSNPRRKPRGRGK